MLQLLSNASATPSDTTKRDTSLTKSDKLPEYPGGVNGLYRHITKKLEYPPLAQLIGCMMPVDNMPVKSKIETYILVMNDL